MIRALSWQVTVVLLGLTLSASSVRDANAPSAALLRLGHALFRSPLLSSDRSTACVSCHVPRYSYSGGIARAVGVAGFTSLRRAPALLDLQDVHGLMWDGRATDLAAQIPLPLESPEMAIAWPDALARINADPVLRDAARATGEAPLDRDRVISALAAYAGSLRTGSSRFDQFYRGHNPLALSDQEQQGFRMFVRRAGCASCHLVQGDHPRFTDDGFHAIGIGENNPVDLGCAGVTGRPEDRWRFKTPGLRDVGRRPYLMHDGSMTKRSHPI